MILRLDGIVLEHDGSQVIVSCSGVGYGVVVCLDEQGGMPTGKQVTLHIIENIKEDAHDLYGFITKSRRELFKQLTSVNGVGPKAAMAIISLASEDLIRKAIAAGDTAFLSRASGVGKKVAERVVVDLKSKVGLVAASDATSFLSELGIGDSDEAVQAMMSLGYSLQDAKLVMQNIDTSLPLEKRVALALKGGK
jgi:holliday junction DNA helicase RuvA